MSKQKEIFAKKRQCLKNNFMIIKSFVLVITQETKKNKELNLNDNKNIAVVINCLEHKDFGYDCCRRFINGQVGQKWSEYQPLIKI